MTDAQLAAAAGIPLRILLAIRAVESAGRANAVRFEPRLFHRDTDNRYRAQVPWSSDLSARDLPRAETDRAAFERAFRYDPRVAVRSSSWGAYQVLGGHLLSVRGPDPARAVAAFDANPATVGREMFVSWFAANPRAQAAANAGDIETLADIYNGSQIWAAAVRRALDRLPPGAGMAVATGAGILLPALFAGGALWYYLRRSR